MGENSEVRRRGGEQKKAGGGGGPQQGEKKPERSKPFQGRYNPKASDRYGSVSHKSLAKFAMFFGAVFILVYQNYNKSDVQCIAKVTEVIEVTRSQQMLCAPNYKAEIQALDPVCLPARCGRMISDVLVTDEEVHRLLDLAKKGLAQGGGAGGATILDLHSGALSKEKVFINLYKTQPNLFTERDFQAYRTVKDKVKAAVAAHFNLDNSVLHLTHPTFFSELTAVPAVTEHDEYWHPHIDKETYPSYHYTSLLYLSEHRRDFTGGRFLFLDEGAKVNRSVEPRDGRVSAFTSGPENRHMVEPVTGGTRYALTMGFTCDPGKAIKDPGF